ncbi:MAG TPA: metallophosphoesterase family protein [Bacillales bacterium]|nr:metallophosphoesterase family protein [Bacillales bacterium]
MEKRVLAVSDVHGEADKLERLLQKTGYDREKDQLILLGDYVDRGPDSKRTVEKVIALHKEGAIVLKGNHDEMMEQSFRGERERYLNVWLLNGGLETLKAYGYDIPEADGRMPELVENAAVRDHLDFFQQLPLVYTTEDYIFAHAGVDPDKPLDACDANVLLWIRDRFHAGYKGDKTVVFGHTPTSTFHDSCDVYFGDNNIIGIDGGCVFGGRLNALELPSRKVYFVE